MCFFYFLLFLYALLFFLIFCLSHTKPSCAAGAVERKRTQNGGKWEYKKKIGETFFARSMAPGKWRKFCQIGNKNGACAKMGTLLFGLFLARLPKPEAQVFGNQIHCSELCWLVVPMSQHKMRTGTWYVLSHLFPNLFSKFGAHGSLGYGEFKTCSFEKVVPQANPPRDSS